MMTTPQQPLPGSFIPSNTYTTPPPGAIQDRNEAFAQGAVHGSAGLEQQQDLFNRSVPCEITQALVGTFAQTTQSGNGMSAQDAQTRNLYGKVRLGASSNGIQPDSYQKAAQRYAIPLTQNSA